MPPEAAGYASERYARSQAHAGRPRRLERSGAWLLERPTPGGDGRDAAGCYPLLACTDWTALESDLAGCGDLVSVVAVPDPWADPAAVRPAFPDLWRAFKEHYVRDLEAGEAPSKHHRYYARRALRSVEVVEAVDPPAHLDEWCGLYGTLVDRHRLAGVHAFPRESFAEQLRVPGAVLLRAVEAGRAVAAHLWFVAGGVAYSHLAASSPRGYELGAAYALHAAAVELLRDRAGVLHLGGGAGGDGDRRDGLTAFKAGWATGTRTAHLAGRVLDRERYRALVAAHPGPAGYFPAYRGVPAT